MNVYGQPPTWLIMLVIGALALPSSAVFGLLAVWLWRHFIEPSRQLPHG